MSTLPTEISSNYKQTDVGIFPIDWEIHNLPDVIWFQEGPGLRKWQFKTKGLKVINVTNLQENGFLDLDRTDRHISWEEFEKTYKHFVCDEGDLVIASSGNSYCKVSIVRACDLPLLMNTSVIRFKPLGTFSKSYMDVYLKSKYFKDQIDLMITGGAQPNFGPAHLSLVKIPAPVCAQEQTAIANALSDVDALIQELEKLIAKKQAIKTATMQQLLTGRTRLPQFAHHPDGRKKGYKPSELGEIPEDWEVVEFGDLIKYVIDNRGKTPPLNSDGVALLEVNSIYNQGKNPNLKKVTKFVSNSTFNTWFRNGHPQQGDTLVVTVGSAGSTSFVDNNNFCIAQNLISIRPRENVSSEYFYYLTTSLPFKKQVEAVLMGAVQPSLKVPHIKKFKFCISNCEQEQRSIATIVSNIDEELQALEQRISKTRQIKQGMMQELLTGKTRLVKPVGAAE